MNRTRTESRKKTRRRTTLMASTERDIVVIGTSVGGLKALDAIAHRSACINLYRCWIQSAKSVRDFLVQEGIVTSSISSRGFGKGQPVATNDTAAGRQQNHRVELVV